MNKFGHRWLVYQRVNSIKSINDIENKMKSGRTSWPVILPETIRICTNELWINCSMALQIRKTGRDRKPGWYRCPFSKSIFGHVDNHKSIARFRIFRKFSFWYHANNVSSISKPFPTVINHVWVFLSIFQTFPIIPIQKIIFRISNHTCLCYKERLIALFQRNNKGKVSGTCKSTVRRRP